MNQRYGTIRLFEANASPLESFGGQKIATETYTKARELRRWIAGHPECTQAEMPEGLRGYLNFLMMKRLVTWRGIGSARRYFVRKL